MNNDDDPEIYNVLSYMLLFIGLFVLYRVFTLNDQDDDECKLNEHSN